MFDKTELDAYNSIKAPIGLYDKVMNAKPDKKPVYLIPMVSALAACLVLMLCISAFTKSYKPQIVFNGQELQSSVVFYDISPAAETEMRTVPTLTIPVELEWETSTEISVSYGSICREGYPPTDSFTTEGSAVFNWEIVSATSLPLCEMTLRSSQGTSVITLTYNEADGSYTAEIN